jgi:glucosamine 6-phosphate synthetase-like amidotransferase/phosphosugar isomerase protein
MLEFLVCILVSHQSNPAETGLDEASRNVLYLPALQLMAYYRSLAKGLNPDRRHNLETVVKLAL